MSSPFEDAMQNTLDRLGVEQDDDLVIYNKLEDYHFKGLNRRYGTEAVNRYIKIMEAKRLGIKRIGEK